MSDVEAFERCVSAGGIVLFPSDTVYGLACDPSNPDAVRRLYALKRRELGKPSALMFFSMRAALSYLPPLGERTRRAFERLLPGGVTLLLPNPDHRFPLACGEDGAILGLRVPDVPMMEAVRVPVLQSSANLAGGVDPRRLDDVPEQLRAAVDLEMDGGELPGTSSTIVDLRRYEQDGSWLVVRRGAVGEEELMDVLGGQFQFHPGSYEQEIRQDIPAYDVLQQELVRLSGEGARRILELGTGTGVTTRLLLDRHPEAMLVGIDASEQMLAAARRGLPGDRVELRVARLQDALPAGPFDLVVSALAVHHLDAGEKGDLFRRVAAVLAPGGRFVLADVIAPADPEQARTPLTPGFDKPSALEDQLRWLTEAGLRPSVAWEDGDLAVFAAAMGPR